MAQHSGPVSVLKWKDKRKVTMILTYHGEETRMKLTKCRQEKQKPVSVLDYNENMRGVDLKNHLLQPYLLEIKKKMTKWYIKLFRRLLNIIVLNCMIICHANSGQTKIDHFKFRVELVYALLIEHASGSVRKFQGHHSTNKNVLRLVERHFPERIPTEKKARQTKRYVVCYKNNRRKETVFWCPEREAALCVEECFKGFHTKLNF